MHELSIAEGIAEVVEKTATANEIQRIVSVRVAVGELAGVDIDALLFAWDSVRETPLLSASKLVIERPKGEAWCMVCGKTVALHRHGDPCPVCGGYQLAATGGHEMKVLDFEVPEDTGAVDEH